MYEWYYGCKCVTRNYLECAEICWAKGSSVNYRGNSFRKLFIRVNSEVTELMDDVSMQIN